MLSNISWVSRISSIVFLLSILTVNWESDRTDFVTLIVAYALAFITYLILIKQSELKFSQLAAIAISAQILSMLFEPNLSVDYYRFLWDGEMAWNSINPFDYRPTEVIQQPFLRNNEYLHAIYDGMSDLSRKNYSCYPTVNQSYFVASTAFSSSIAVNTFILKLLIVLTEFIGAMYLIKILKHLKISINRAWILFLNPLWIIECTGNVHFEGVMISFVFIALYFLIQKRAFIGGVWFAIAVQIKLIPLMFLPFFLRYLGWIKTTVFIIVTLLLATAIGFIHLDGNNLSNFVESLTLYVRVFEFNSIFYYNIMQYGKSVYGWVPARTYGPLLTQFSLFVVLVQAFWGNADNWKKVFGRLTVALFIYLLLTSTVHPWYILPILALSLFTNYSFPVVWSFLIFFSYFFYSINTGSATEVRLLITVEYAIVLGVFVYEIIKKRPLIPFLALGKDDHQVIKS